jgi:serine/threonine-protein kinase HipA
MKVGEAWKFLDIGNDDWERAAKQLGVPGDQAIAWVDDLREGLPEAFERAVASLPSDVQDEAGQMAEHIVEHVNGIWRPDLDRDPRYVLDNLPPGPAGSAPRSGGGPTRAKTTPR